MLSRSCALAQRGCWTGESRQKLLQLLAISQGCWAKNTTAVSGNSTSVSSSPGNIILTQFFQTLYLLVKKITHQSAFWYLSCHLDVSPWPRLGAVFIHFTEISKICTQFLCGHAPILFSPIFSQSKTRLRRSSQPVRLPGCVTQDSQGERGASLWFMYPKLYHSKCQALVVN